MRILKDQEPRRTAFEREALLHMDSLYNLALWMTRSREESGDLVQETYLRALRFSHQYEPGTNLRGWLFKIMRNTYLNRYRKKKREPAWSSLDDPPGGAPARANADPKGRDLGGDGASEPWRGLVRSDIDKALARLPEEFRVTIILSDLEGLSQEEVADALGCPKGTVKSRLFRGRRLLKELLKDYSG